MKAVTFGKTKIHCDTCHHEFDGEPEDWHNKPCPACSAPEIISDQDLAAYKGMREMAELINAVAGEIPDDKKSGSINVKVSTAPLRTNTDRRN